MQIWVLQMFGYKIFLFLIMKAQVGDDDISTTSPRSSLQGTCLLSAYLQEVLTTLAIFSFFLLVHLSHHIRRGQREVEGENPKQTPS